MAIQDLPLIWLPHWLFVAILAVAVFAATRLFRNPHVAHALWIAILLKLLIPPSAAFYYVSVSQSHLAELLLTQKLTNQFEVATSEKWQIVTSIVANPSDPSRQTAGVPRSDAADARFDSADWWRVLARLWGLGSVLFLAGVLWRIRHFRRVTADMLPASTEMQETAVRMAVTLGLKRCPPIRLTVMDVSPMVWINGAESVIVLPLDFVNTLSQASLRSVLAHELAHIRRRDHWIRLLELVAASMYWWHPVVWLAKRELRRNEDLCCDAMVLRTLGECPKAYANTIFQVLREQRPARSAVPLASRFANGNFSKRRIEMVLSNRWDAQLANSVRSLLIGSVIGVLSVSVTITGMAGEDDPFGRTQNVVENRDDRPVSQEKHAIIVPAEAARAHPQLQADVDWKRDVIPMQHSPAIDVATVLAKLFSDGKEGVSGVVIQAEPTSNAIAISAPAPLFSEIVGFIQKMDVAPQMIMVDVVLMQIPAAVAGEEVNWLRSYQDRILSAEKVAEFKLAVRQEPGVKVVGQPKLMILNNQPGVVRLVKQSDQAAESSPKQGLMLGVTARATTQGLIAMEFDVDLPSSGKDTVSLQTTVSLQSGQGIVIGGIGIDEKAAGSNFAIFVSAKTLDRPD
jgi:beta-lactamase regulating signal transducer with metallopeptidase domain